MEIHKIGPSAPPAPEPIDFLRISNDSGGIPHPENAHKSQNHAELHGFHVFSGKSGNGGNLRFPVNSAFWSGGALQKPPQTLRL